MDTFEESMGRMAQAVGDFSKTNQKPSAFYIGRVEEAGGGVLRVSCGGMPLYLDDLWVSAALRYDWIKDDGSPELLHQGDRVILLSQDGQIYDLIARMVRG